MNNDHLFHSVIKECKSIEKDSKLDKIHLKVKRAPSQKSLTFFQNIFFSLLLNAMKLFYICLCTDICTKRKKFTYKSISFSAVFYLQVELESYDCESTLYLN